ncbi:hypothetical protein KIN20_037944 [Parelaphostrongylus tenuis]|uniref:Uncharacterized protein n=1 Tax=Parelaphostrongylus tenuis TaxID=148309 RepID=A0AAD5WLF9_PARTN|nr:hypothetical protein KIN20_037944 [Parelaphostrongylus tenuis]
MIILKFKTRSELVDFTNLFNDQGYQIKLLKEERRGLQKTVANYDSDYRPTEELGSSGADCAVRF